MASKGTKGIERAVQMAGTQIYHAQADMTRQAPTPRPPRAGPHPTFPRIPKGSPVADSFRKPEREEHPPEKAAAVNGISIAKNTPLGSGATNDEASTVDEPSVASKDNIVFFTGNWFACISTDGGNSFTYVNPFTTFPPKTRPPAPGSFCCDQVVHYLPGIDTFVWLLQYTQDANGENLQRIAFATSAEVVTGNWHYFDLTSQLLAAPGQWLDFPDMAVGANSLYVSTNVFDNNNSWVKSIIIRIPSVGFTPGHVPQPKMWSSSNNFSFRLAQNCGDTIYWAAHIDTSRIRVYSWAENSDQPVTHDVPVPSWSDNMGGISWLSSYDNRILGATKVGNELWFAWGVGPRTDRPFLFIEIPRIDASSFTVVGSEDVWDSSMATGFPALATNPATDEVGISYTDGDDIPSHVVGILTGTPKHTTTANGQSTVNRWGDYLTVRPHNMSSKLFSATGYTLDAGGAAIPRFVQFGRESNVHGHTHGGSDQPGENAIDVRAATEAAQRLFDGMIEKLRASSSKDAPGGLFPDGVSLIDFQLTVASVTLHLRIAGKDCCKGS